MNTSGSDAELIFSEAPRPWPVSRKAGDGQPNKLRRILMPLLDAKELSSNVYGRPARRDGTLAQFWLIGSL